MTRARQGFYSFMGREYFKGSDMGKRKSGKRITERKKINVSVETHANYKKFAEKYHVKDRTMGEMAGYFMDLHIDHDFYKGGFYERMMEDKKNAKIQKKQSSISEEIGEDRCDGLVKREIPGKEDEVLKVIFICVKGSSTGTVKLKKLGVDPSKICIACKKTMNLEARWAQIRSKDKLGVEEHTYCIDGGWYDDKSGRIHCKRQDRWQNQDICFKIAHGNPCPSLKTLPARRVKRTGIQRRKR